MKYELENSELKVSVESKGAELSNLLDKKTGFEYMWQKDKKYWGKSSPVLFPFVGGLKNQKFTYKGKEYQICTRHGFARDNEFIVSKRGENFIEFLFESNEETREKYPFDFKLYLKYILKGKELEIEYRVENLTNGEMYFSLGAHPAFNIFGEEGENFLEFEKNESGESIAVINGCVVEERKKIFEGKILNFTDETFKNDAIIFENTNSKKIWLKSNKNDKILQFDYTGFHYIAFWSVPNSKFICFEPWDGISDTYNASGDITEKLGIEKLEKNGVYQKSIKITII